MNYINVFKRKLVNSVNMESKKRLVIDYAVTDYYTFSLLDKEGKPVTVNDSDLFYFAIDTEFKLDTPVCVYCDDYTIDDNTITFKVNTYTAWYLQKIRHAHTTAYIEIGRKTEADETYKIILKDEVIAEPRIYVVGTTLPDTKEHFYTTAEVDTLLSQKVGAEVIAEIEGSLTSLASDLNFKVDKEAGKGLSTEDFTTEFKLKLASLSSYDDTEIKTQMLECQTVA